MEKSQNKFKYKSDKWPIQKLKQSEVNWTWLQKLRLNPKKYIVKVRVMTWKASANLISNNHPQFEGKCSKQAIFVIKWTCQDKRRYKPNGKVRISSRSDFEKSENLQCDNNKVLEIRTVSTRIKEEIWNTTKKLTSKAKVTKIL